MLVPSFEWSTPTLMALWLLWLSVISHTVPSPNPSLQEYACDVGQDNNATFISNSIPVYLRVSMWPIDGKDNVYMMWCLTWVALSSSGIENSKDHTSLTKLLAILPIMWTDQIMKPYRGKENQGMQRRYGLSSVLNISFESGHSKS